MLSEVKVTWNLSLLRCMFFATFSRNIYYPLVIKFGKEYRNIFKSSGNYHKNLGKQKLCLNVRLFDMMLLYNLFISFSFNLDIPLHVKWANFWNNYPKVFKVGAWILAKSDCKIAWKWLGIGEYQRWWKLTATIYIDMIEQ